MALKRLLLSLLCAGMAVSAPAQGYYNVRDFGAKGDGTTLDWEALNRAVEAASAAGGGTAPRSDETTPKAPAAAAISRREHFRRFSMRPMIAYYDPSDNWT